MAETRLKRPRLKRLRLERPRLKRPKRQRPKLQRPRLEKTILVEKLHLKAKATISAAGEVPTLKMLQNRHLDPKKWPRKQSSH